MLKLGDIIKDSRIKLGLSQKTLAETIGISPQYLHDLESGGRLPSDDVLDKLAIILHQDYDYFSYLVGRYPNDIREGVNYLKVKLAFDIMRG